jgi:hypothetical protein
VGSTAAYADMQGPTDLSSGWNTPISYYHYDPGYYSFYDSANLWSNGANQIYVNWVRAWGGWANINDDVWNGFYIFSSYDPYNYDFSEVFFGRINLGRDITASIGKYYNVPSGYYMELYMYSYVYAPMFWNPTDGWFATP